MAFVGQINFGQLHRAAGGSIPLLPARGVLALFYDLEEQRWGFDPGDRDFWRVTFVADADEAVALVPPQQVREAFVPHGLVASVGASLPAPGDAHQARFPSGFARYLSRSYGVLHAGFRREQLGAIGTEHQVFGHAHWMDRDARAQAELATRGLYCGDLISGGAAEPAEVPGEWALLWQISSDDGVGFRWGDGGNLYLLIREVDLRAGRWGRSWLVLQC